MCYCEVDEGSPDPAEKLGDEASSGAQVSLIDAMLSGRRGKSWEMMFRSLWRRLGG